MEGMPDVKWDDAEIFYRVDNKRVLTDIPYRVAYSIIPKSKFGFGRGSVKLDFQLLRHQGQKRKGQLVPIGFFFNQVSIGDETYYAQSVLPQAESLMSLTSRDVDVDLLAAAGEKLRVGVRRRYKTDDGWEDSVTKPEGEEDPPEAPAVYMNATIEDLQRMTRNKGDIVLMVYGGKGLILFPDGNYSEFNEKEKKWETHTAREIIFVGQERIFEALKEKEAEERGRTERDETISNLMAKIDDLQRQLDDSKEENARLRTASELNERAPSEAGSFNLGLMDESGRPTYGYTMKPGVKYSKNLQHVLAIKGVDRMNKFSETNKVTDAHCWLLARLTDLQQYAVHTDVIHEVLLNKLEEREKNEMAALAFDGRIFDLDSFTHEFISRYGEKTSPILKLRSVMQMRMEKKEEEKLEFATFGN